MSDAVRQHHKLASTGKLGQDQTVATGGTTNPDKGKPSGAPPGSVTSTENMKNKGS